MIIGKIRVQKLPDSRNGSLLLTVPKGSGFKAGDHVVLTKLEEQ